MRILVVEDDTMILDGLCYSLCQEGYEVTKAGSVSEAEQTLSAQGLPEVCLLDVCLPDGTGFEICERIRRTSSIPILFLTACADEVSAVRALEIGADDYIEKPFRIRELLARIKAVLRRSGGTKAEETLIRIGENEVDLKTGKTKRTGEEIVLTAMEYRLLLLLIANRGQILTREQILDRLWDEVGDFVNDNTLSVYMKRLRKKLADSDDAQLITTVRGIGYRLEE